MSSGSWYISLVSPQTAPPAADRGPDKIEDLFQTDRIAPGRQTVRYFFLRGFSRSRQEAHAGVVWHPNEASHSSAKGQHVEDDV